MCVKGQVFWVEQQRKRLKDRPGDGEVVSEYDVARDISVCIAGKRWQTVRCPMSSAPLILTDMETIWKCVQIIRKSHSAERVMWRERGKIPRFFLNVEISIVLLRPGLKAAAELQRQPKGMFGAGVVCVSEMHTMLKTAVIAQTWGCAMSWEDKREEEKIFNESCCCFEERNREWKIIPNRGKWTKDKYVKLLNESTIIVLCYQIYHIVLASSTKSQLLCGKRFAISY